MIFGSICDSVFELCHFGLHYSDPTIYRNRQSQSGTWDSKARQSRQIVIDISSAQASRACSVAALPFEHEHQG